MSWYVMARALGLIGLVYVEGFLCRVETFGLRAWTCLGFKGYGLGFMFRVSGFAVGVRLQ